MSDVILADHSLKQLAGIAVRSKNEADECASSALSNAIKCGQALAAAKEKVKHGEWLPWLEKNWPFSRRLAQSYMDLANAQSSAHLESASSISEALRILDASKEGNEEQSRTADDEVDVAFDEESFECTTCGDTFDIPVWHCDTCDQHYGEDTEVCPHCDGEPVSADEEQDHEEDKITSEELEREDESEITEDEPELEKVQERPYRTLEEWEAMSVIERQEIIDQPCDTKFNKQDTASIEWAQWSWNPITGCKHDCPYCYARDIAHRFYPQKFEPSIYPGRLAAAENTKVPSTAEDDVSFKNVFTCSMADLFGKWVPLEWIELVFDVVEQNPQWNFLFLTKFPQRFAELESIPENAWLGTTVDCQSRVKNAEKAFAKCGGGTKWLSVEPMLTPIKFSSLEMFDWVVIGGASSSSKTPKWQPPFDWVADLHWQARDAGCAIYHKDNLGFDDGIRLKEFPWMDEVEYQLPDSLKYLDIK